MKDADQGYISDKELIKTFPMKNIIAAMSRVQDLILKNNYR